MTVAPARMVRLDRWTWRNGLKLEGLTWAGAELLETRLAIRRRADRVAWSVGTVAVGCLVAFMVSAGTNAPTRLDVSAWWWAATIVFSLVAVTARSVLIRRGEQRLEAQLPRRVAADTAVSVSRRIGLLRLVNCAIVFAVSASVIVLLTVDHVSTSLVVLYALALCAVTATAVIVGLRDITRAALAVDDASLRVDDRWRSQAMYTTLLPLMLTYLAGRVLVPLPGHGLGWLSWWYGVVPVLFVRVIEDWAQWRDNRRLGRPAPWARWLHRA